MIYTAKRNKALYFVFSIALLVRLIHIAEVSYTRPFYQEFYNDAKVSDQWGREIAAGNILGKGVPEQDPLYAYFLGLTYFIFGHNLLLVVLIQCVVGAFSAVLVLLVGVRLFNKTVGLIASLMWSFYPIIIFYEGLIMREGLAVFLTLLAVHTLIVAGESGCLWHWLVGGIFLGLSSLTRGNTLFVIPFIFLWLILEHKGDFVKPSAMVLLGLILVFTPVIIRNRLVVGGYAVTTSRAGINFYWGNNKEARGSYIPAPGFVRATAVYELGDFAREAMRITGREMSNSEVSSFWFRRGLEFVYYNPAQYARLQYQKFRLLFNRAEVSDNYQYYYYKRFSSIVDYSPVGFMLIAPLGLFGMAISIKDWRRLSLLYLFVISYSLSVIIFFVISRYRLPITPLLTIFAANSLHWYWTRAYEKRYPVILTSITPLSVLFLFVGSDIRWLTSLNRCDVLYREGFEFESKGDYGRAEARYLEAAKVLPSSYSAHFGLGEVYMRKRRPHDAAKEYRLAIQAMPMSALARFKLGTAYIDTGNHDEAIREFLASLELVSEQFPSYYGLAVAYERKGMPDEAVKYWKEYLRRDPEGEWSSLARSRIERRSRY